MGCMLRSDKMTFCEMFIQPESAFEILSYLGEKGIAQIEDMTPDLNPQERTYISELCRCSELERTLIFLKEEMFSDKIPIAPLRGKPPPALYPHEMIDFENMMEKWKVNIGEMKKYHRELLKNLKYLQEMHYVYQDVEPFIGSTDFQRRNLMFRTKSMIAIGAQSQTFGGKLHIFTGVVRRSRCYAFETMLWRVSRGNMYFRTASEDLFFEQPVLGHMIRKVAFLLVCQGAELKEAIEKVCSGFHVHLYDCPMGLVERHLMHDKLKTRIDDIIQVIRKTKYHRCKQLRLIGKSYEIWYAKVKKAKAIYYNMNHFSIDITKRCLIGQCWMPTSDLNATFETFKEYSQGTSVKSFINVLETIEQPPTYHRVNKFTRGFQNLINSYGTSHYRELNPGLYTIITFPFLFAVMFGDCGHAIIMTCFAAWMVLREKKYLEIRSTNEIWNIFFSGRYIILLMGLFSIYTGFLYNDWFSKPMKLKENYWVNQYTSNEIWQNERLTLDPAGKTRSYYALGVDPVWGFSLNKINNENSLKMKMSIILGIIHMWFGLLLSLFNHIHFRKYYAVVLEFLPQVIFLTCLFVWLVVLILVKWLMYGPKKTDIKLQPGCAPFVLILYIDMCLMRQAKVEDSNCDAYMFANQEMIQKVLLLTGIGCIPIMLFGSPVYLLITNRSKRVKAERKLDDYMEKKKVTGSVSELHNVDKMEQCLRNELHHYSESFSELMIHQGVHTIEYVLSTISHTASYLRLWALSLAHARRLVKAGTSPWNVCLSVFFARDMYAPAFSNRCILELSEMLWGMVLSKQALADYSRWGSIKIFIVFAIWAAFSLSVLVVMEGLSAFLHTLRLHWVEFMSKFYIGSGNLFRPFSFHDILYGDGKDDMVMETSCTLKKKAN